MGRKYAIRDQEGLYFVTFTVVDWIDVFTRDAYKQIIIDSLQYCQENKGLLVYAYCIMTNHIHFILSVVSGHKLSDVIRDFKSFTSLEIKKSIAANNHDSRREWLLRMFERTGKANIQNKEFQLWQQNNHPIELSTNETLKKVFGQN